MNVCIQLPLRLLKIQDQKSLTHRWLSFSEWCQERVSLVFHSTSGQDIRPGQWYTIVNILQLAERYLNATIKRKTRKLELEIGTDRSSQSWQTLTVDGYGSRFGPPRCGMSGFCTGFKQNQMVLVVGIRTTGGLPGPIANTISECTKVYKFHQHFKPFNLLCRDLSHIDIWCWLIYQLYWCIKFLSLLFVPGIDYPINW